MMQVKRYEAVDMGEALKLIKNDLGPNAVILSTRTVKKGSSAFGLFGRPVIEVTAALAQQPAEEAPHKPVRQGRYRAQDPVAETKNMIETTVAVMEPLLEGIDDIRRNLSKISAKEETPEKTAERIEDDVRELKSMISYLMDQAEVEKEQGLGRSYLSLLRIMKDRGVASEYALALLDEIREKSEGHGEPDLKTLLSVTANRMKDTLILGGWINGPGNGGGSPRVVSLVGPTGVGKTTTVAKIAARLTMEGAKVGLATIDTFRIAAVEQLKIYAKILNIPLEVILTPQDLGRTLHMYSSMDVVLIDTAGRSQRDLEQIDELKKFYDMNPAVDARLVLSAGASEKQNSEAIRNFSALPVSGLIFTKLDEAGQLGTVFNQHVRTGLPISYFTTGQRVPEDIEEATAKRLINGIFAG
ncbi:MAG: flagellar biosynthesis protein FlhF [Nitrospinae bacterium]|nr:flagellar biosynthesis protein FlhF [Nitrospinota bacterium]